METPDWSSLSREERYETAFKTTYETAFKKTCTLADYLHDELEHDRQQIDRGGTNITAALRLAREIIDATLRSDLSAYGISKSVSLIGQRPFHTPDEKVIEVPNVRAMIYSDGEHNQGALENAFADMQPVSVLMTAFIGDDLDEEGNTRPGAEDMRKLATICPAHRLAGYFLINDSERGEVLRDIFHMATGTSGLCLRCRSGKGA